MDRFKWVTVISTIIASILGIGSFIVVLLNRRSTVKKEVVDGMAIELSLRKDDSARRDEEIKQLKELVRELKERVKELEARLNQSDIKDAIQQTTITRLERANLELMTEDRIKAKKIARLQGHDSDDA